jgi:hypothetical protein
MQWAHIVCATDEIESEKSGSRSFRRPKTKLAVRLEESTKYNIYEKNKQLQVIRY